MKIKNILWLLIALVSFHAVSSSACEAPESKAFPPLDTGNGYIVFNEVPLLGGDGVASVDETSIDVGFVSCADGTEKRISGLPFLAATGRVRAAFFSDAKDGGSPKLFIIHSVEISSDTGVRYSGEYYTVHVYSKSSSGYRRDERLSNYFGTGGDVLSDGSETDLKYEFPYKTSSEIIERLSSGSYRKWLVGEPVKLEVDRKTFIYSAPNTADVTRMYLVKGDVVLQEDVGGGWVKIMFKSAKNKEIRGWIISIDAAPR